MNPHLIHTRPLWPLLTHFLVVGLIVSTTACTVKVSTPGQALIHNQSKSDVFDLVTQAFSEADFIILSVNERTGFISARHPQSLLNKRDTHINCTVKEVESTEEKVVQVDVTSTLSGQLVALGATTNAIKVLFKHLFVHLPDAKFTMDGKPFDPNDPNPKRKGQ